MRTARGLRRAVFNMLRNRPTRSSNMRKNAARGRRGFSLIEAMVSAAVLGIGLLGVVELHRSSVRGLAIGRSITVASQIASQRAELIAGREADALNLPSCPVAADNNVGCKATRDAFAADKTCTAWLLESDVPTPAGADVANAPNQGFRRDIVITPHPDTINHAGSFVATISVCWRDQKNFVQELRQQKLLVPGA